MGNFFATGTPSPSFGILFENTSIPVDIIGFPRDPGDLLDEGEGMKRDDLFIKQFVDEGLGNSSYLIGSSETGRAAAIDPQRDVDRYLQIAEGMGLRLAYCLDTHLHADFVSGARELAARVTEPFCIGASAKAALEFDHLFLVTISANRWRGSSITRYTTSCCAFTMRFRFIPRTAADRSAPRRHRMNALRPSVVNDIRIDWPRFSRRTSLCACR